MYALYAALALGPRINLLSNDMMREHIQPLNANERQFFRRWQQHHQYTFGLNRMGRFYVIPSDQPYGYVQQIEQYWHIPFTNAETVRHSIHTKPDSYLCLKLL